MGVYNVSQAATPILREQAGGMAVQISSVGGRVGGNPGLASYQADKFAVDGFSRCLASETAAFRIKVLVVEPSWEGMPQVRPLDYSRRQIEEAGT